MFGSVLNSVNFFQLTNFLGKNHKSYTVLEVTFEKMVTN